MAHQMDSKIQEEIKAIPGNEACVDCGIKNPQWASVSYGTLFCLECSGQHSVTMDSWSDKQIQSMRLGGNAKLIAWFKEHGIDPRAPILEKYHTDVAELYRLRLAALRDGKEPPTELPPKQAPPMAATSSDRPMTGFGSQPMPTKSANDPLEEFSKTANELSKTATQTFSMLAGTFSQFGKEAAEKLKEVKITEKLSQTGETLAKTGEKLGETLKDPNLATNAKTAAFDSWSKVSTGAMSLWKTVVETSSGQQAGSHGSSSNAGSGYATMNQDEEETTHMVNDDDEDEPFTKPVAKPVATLTSKQSSTPIKQENLPAKPKEDDDQWLQDQLKELTVAPGGSAVAKPASDKKKDDFFSEFGV